MASELQLAAKLVETASRAFAVAVQKLGSVEDLEKRTCDAGKHLASANQKLEAAKAQLKAAGEVADAAAKKAAELTANIAAKAHADAKPALKAVEDKLLAGTSAVKKANSELADIARLADARRKELADLEARIAKAKSDALKALA